MVGFDFSVAEPKVYFFGYLTSDTAVGAANTWEPLLWTHRQNVGFTHTNGQAAIYVLTTGIYFVSSHVVYDCTGSPTPEHRLLLKTVYTDPDSVAGNTPQVRGAAGSTNVAASSTVEIPTKLLYMEAGSNINFQANHVTALDAAGVYYKALYTSCTLALYARGGSG